MFFYRPSSMVGAAIQPEVRLNGVVVGASKPGGFFYIDRPAGSYTAAASTETEKNVQFDLDAGENKYIKMSMQMGLLVGRVAFTVESPEAAEAELKSLSYTGSAAKAEPGRPVLAATEPRPSPRAATAAAVSVASLPGVRLTFLDSDVISGVSSGETTLTLVETTATQRIYNDGALVTSLDGTPVKGAAHANILYGVGAREIVRGGNWNGRYRAAGIADDVPVTLTVLRKETKVVSGHRFEATRIGIEGYATRSQLYGQSTNNGAYFSGEALVDNATGLVLQLQVTCRHPAYPVRRELVRVSGTSSP